MEKITFRKLEPEEVMLRVESILQPTNETNSQYVALVVPYKDARVDMKLLDETFGPTNWQRKHHIENGMNYCTISVWDPEKKQWIEKEDVGVRQNFEKEKSEASDAFKRAGSNWGIGRELYSIKGDLRIPLSKTEIGINPSTGRTFCTAKFRCSKLETDPNNPDKITLLEIIDINKTVRATYKPAY